MSDKDTISMHLVREALYDTWPGGVPDAAWLRRLGIDPDQLNQPQARVTARVYARLWRSLAQHCQDEFFNMDRRGLPPGSFAYLCRSSLAQPTLGAALDHALAFLGLMFDRLHPRLERRHGLALIVLDEPAPTPRRAFTYFTLWLMVHGLACWLAGRRLPILAIDVRSAAPPFCDDYRVLFCERLRFDRPHGRMIVAADCLDLPIRRSPQALSEFLAGAPGNLLVRYRDPASLGRRVRLHLLGLDPAAWPDGAALAQSLGMSHATLRRRLAEEGQRYQGLKDSVRRELAVAWLAQARFSQAEVAARLGFADESSFYRAFRKWFGCNPGQFRAQVSAPGVE